MMVKVVKTHVFCYEVVVLKNRYYIFERLLHIFIGKYNFFFYISLLHDCIVEYNVESNKEFLYYQFLISPLYLKAISI